MSKEDNFVSPWFREYEKARRKIMRKYRFTGTVTISVVTEVEADTYEEALEEAEGRETEIGPPPTPHTEEEAWTTDELDGVVYDIRCDGAENSDEDEDEYE